MKGKLSNVRLVNHSTDFCFYTGGIALYRATQSSYLGLGSRYCGSCDSNLAFAKMKKKVPRTHCGKGHRFTVKNTGWRMHTQEWRGHKYEYPVRQCRMCEALRHARRKQRKLDALSSGGSALNGPEQGQPSLQCLPVGSQTTTEA